METIADNLPSEHIKPEVTQVKLKDGSSVDAPNGVIPVSQRNNIGIKRLLHTMLYKRSAGTKRRRSFKRRNTFRRRRRRVNSFYRRRVYKRRRY